MRIRLSLLRLSFALFTAALACGAAHAQERFRFDSTPGRLSKQVVPSRYALTLDLDPQRATFDGRAEITLRVRKATPSIELHAFQLDAGEAHLVTGNAKRALTVAAQADTQTWRLTPADGKAVPAGAHRLLITYRGKVNLAGEALFAAPYSVNGQPARMLATQLEPTRARRVYPAFDEPAFRAVFDLTVRAPDAFDVVANMPRVARKAQAGVVVHRFAPTPPMPAYLFAVAVGRFEALEGRAGEVPVRILFTEGKRSQAVFALRAVQQLLPWMRDYFGVPFALPKLDLLAVPGTRWGAMEDWGLISFVDNALLVDPERTGPAGQRFVYSIIAHELAHQWFGDLVTAASWDEIWLNEAFATWLARKGTDRFNPAWQVPLSARTFAEEAFILDAGAATRAIRSGPVAEQAVADVFDPITYTKGGATLAMLEQWIGPETFRRGLAAYMKGQRLSNATAADLWHYIGKAAGKDVRAVAAGWTDREGFPLVRVTTRCQDGALHAAFEQSRFTFAGTPAASGPWSIPLRWRRGAQSGTLLLDAPRAETTLAGCGDDPLIVNAGGEGFYRVAYADGARDAVRTRFARLPAVDRLVLLSDTFAAMQAGRVPLTQYLALLHALVDVQEPARKADWGLVDKQLEFLDAAFAGLPAQQRLHAQGQALLAPQLDRLGWTPAPGEDPLISELRGTWISILARFGHQPTLDAATRAFDADDRGETRLPPSLREAVTRAAGRNADRAHFDRLVARLKATTSEEERRLLARALGGVPDAAMLDELLALSLADGLPSNTAMSLARYAADTSPFSARVYRFAADNWAALAARAGQGGRRYILPSAAERLSEESQAVQLVEDTRRLVGVEGAALAAQAAEEIRLRAGVRAREAAALEQNASN